MSLALPSFKQIRILVIGDLMLDRYWSGSTSRISPEAPVPIVKIGNIEDRLGGSANVANNLAQLGCSVGICGILGDDEAGAASKKLLANQGIVDHTITSSKIPTITKLRVMSRNQQLMRVDFEETLSENSDSALEERISSVLNNYDGVIISDYAKGTITSGGFIISLCKTHNIPVFVDPKGSDFSRYHGANFITPNRSELETIVGASTSLNELFSKAEKLRSEIDLQGILVTLSEQGMALINSEEAPTHMPTVARDVYDVTGAGDTVIAMFAAAIVAGTSEQTAMRLANVAAGVVVGKLGTSAFSLDEITKALASEDDHFRRGVLSLGELKKQIEHCKQKGEKIVFTNGCFDILHAGHVRYLKQAAALGDRLAVAVNSDASIKMLKGSSRPIVNLDERMEVMSSLNCVDWVIPFEEETPLNLIQALNPDVLAKGGDYVVEDIVGYAETIARGGKVCVLPFVEGSSTTSIVEKINQAK